MPAVTLIRDSKGRVTSAVVVGADPDTDLETLQRLAESIKQGLTIFAFDSDWDVTVA